MSHLGSRLSAFVDGRLGVDDAERVMTHVAACAPCAAELAGERQARRALSTAGEVAPEPDLMARLLALRPAEPPSPGARGRVAPRWSDSAGFADSVPLPGEPAPTSARLREDVEAGRRLPALLGVAGCLAVLLAGLVVLGDRPSVSPQVHRAYALRVLAEAVDATGGSGARPSAAAASVLAPVVDTAATSTEVVLGGAAADAGARDWLAENGWVVPDELPPGWTIVAVRHHAHGPGGLEMDLEGPQGTVVVLQQRGRLAPAGAAALSTREVAGRAVHVASRDPWHVLWQCGDVVVSVFAEGHAEAVRQVVAAHPDRPYDDGVPARISRGWSVLAGAWAP